MEIQHLRYFYEVARQGSFSKASRTLRVTQPSISKMVRLLEDHEGVRFLIREKRGVTLTPMGRMLFDSCGRIFSEYASLQQALSNRKNECQGELWIGASDNLSNYIFPELIATFQNEYPKVAIKIFVGASSQIMEKLKDYQVEVGFFYTKVPDKSLLQEELGEVEYWLVASPNLVKKGGDLASLEGLSYIGSRAVDYSGAYPTLKLLRRMKVDPKRIIEANNQETQKRLALTGAGYSLVPVHMVRNEVKEGKLIRLFAKNHFRWPVYLVRRRERALSPIASEWARRVKVELSAK